MSFLREVPRYLHISRYINMLSTSTHYLRISPGGGGRGEEHGDGGAGVRGADPHGRGQVSRGLRHPARQAQGGPGGHREHQHCSTLERLCSDHDPEGGAAGVADAADGGGGAVHLLPAVGVGARGLLPRRHQAGQGELSSLHPVSVLLRGRLRSHLQTTNTINFFILITFYNNLLRIRSISVLWILSERHVDLKFCHCGFYPLIKLISSIRVRKFNKPPNG